MTAHLLSLSRDRLLWSARRYDRSWPIPLKNSLENARSAGYAEAKALEGEQRP